MQNFDFWTNLRQILDEGFSTRNLKKLDEYAEQFTSQKLIYQRFSSGEQHGCSAGGPLHVIASLLAGADVAADKLTAPAGSFKRECQLGEAQIERIELWSKAAGCWIEDVDNTISNQLGEHISEGGEAKVYVHGHSLVKTIGLDYYIQPLLALDRISLHNAYFPETKLTVLGFGKTDDNAFKIVVEQPFIQGHHISESEITDFAQKIGFSLINSNNWTYATPEIYLSGLHDENVIQSKDGNIFVIDCDIRINVPELKAKGNREISNQIIQVD